MRRSAQLMVVAGLAAAYLPPASSGASAQTDPAPVREPSRETDKTASPSDPELKTGIMLRSVGEHDWGLRLNVSLSVGLTEFDLASGVSLDDVATVSVVPTAEFIIPLDNKWTLLPFVGAGGAAVVGDHEAVSGESALGLVSGGLRTQRWQPFAERWTIPARIVDDALEPELAELVRRLLNGRVLPEHRLRRVPFEQALEVVPVVIGWGLVRLEVDGAKLQPPTVVTPLISAAWR